MDEREMHAVIGEIHDALNELYELDGSWRSLGQWPEETTGSELLDGASDEEIAALEASAGHPLPPSYAAFLRLHAGWLHFWGDHVLVGVGREETRPALEEIAENIAEQVEDLQRVLGDDPAAEAVAAWEAAEERNLCLTRHIVIGTDFGGEHWVYDTGTRRADGEMTLVKWTIDYGGQEPAFATFHEFLDWHRQEVVARLEWTRRQVSGAPDAD